MNNIELNPQFATVLNFVNQTNRSVFLTGKAGTGKTTLLKYIKQHTIKQMAVVAPTGVAAINAGGSTIHSFFQFPFAPFLPTLHESGDVDPSRTSMPVLRYTSQRLSLFRKLELLVIDEISMVRADLLDQVDLTLRQTRRKWQQPFGGVQVLLIGDMHQLPPVVQPEEWKMLNAVYPSPYFFDSLVMRRHMPVHIELHKIYRQNDQVFIDLLNKVRSNSMAPADLELLNSHYRPELSQAFLSDNITLTTHNNKADDINTRLLEALSAKKHVFKCRVEGTFNEKSYPAEPELVLKEGARVMFLKNNVEKNYYNGKIGYITSIQSDRISVRCTEDRGEIEVTREAWTNVNYTVNRTSNGIEENVLGTFTQFPLRLAWAITIHKSQGLTFDQVIIDAGASFSAGQVYVALSRCRSLKGLTLSSRIDHRVFIVDKKINDFSASRAGDDALSADFQRAREAYFRSLLSGLFDLSELQQARQVLAGAWQLHLKRLHHSAQAWVQEIYDTVDKLAPVAAKFSPVLAAMLAASADPASDAALQQRVRDAATYFYSDLRALLNRFDHLPALTESREAADEIDEALRVIYDELYAKTAMMKVCRDGFNMEAYLKARASLRYPDLRGSIYESARNTSAPSDVKYPDLYRSLLLLRDEICNDEHKPIYMVASGKTLKELVELLPLSSDDLMRISGFGEAKVEAWGDRFLELIGSYVREHQLQPDREALQSRKAKRKKSGPAARSAETATAEKEEKVPSRENTYALFREGLSVQELAIARKLSVGTVESHLAYYVASGDIPVDTFVSRDKQKQIAAVLESSGKTVGFAALKKRLPDSISYSDIKYVMASRQSAADS